MAGDRLAEVAAELGPDAEVARCSDPAGLDAALDRGHEMLVVAGGDGTLHTVAGALYRRGELASRTVGLVPMGTGNDFARGTGIPLQPVAAARALRAGTARPLDLIVDDTGVVTVNAVHMGVGADSTRAASRLKRWLGPASFPVGGLIAGWAARGYRLRVEADGEVVIGPEHRVLLVGLANGPRVGGGHAILDPDARPDDGRIRLVVSRSRGPAARLMHAVRLHRGTHPMELDLHRRSAAVVRVSGEPCSATSDGEIEDGIVDRTWRVLPGAWNFVLPDQPDRTSS
ncbi:diacylglycerol/lipid kinase family protein [Marinitenerispora sediminis]|uniref:diacylglycerol/lipid kinase family protein n=1 Tax=Marinitenerispora sediminis TaxID=1931232 RepID=UPI001F48B5C8|nr:diacylglycerol kinase family protein [Marinitenerispora sediminis]